MNPTGAPGNSNNISDVYEYTLSKAYSSEEDTLEPSQ